MINVTAGPHFQLTKQTTTKTAIGAEWVALSSRRQGFAYRFKHTLILLTSHFHTNYTIFSSF